MNKSDKQLNELVRDLTKVHPRPKSEVKRMIQGYVDFKIKEIRDEVVKRRDKEIYVMMEASYAKGWDFERFLKTFAQLINKK